MKRTTLVLTVLVAVGAGGFAWKLTRPVPATEVQVTKVVRVPKLRSLVSATGEIRAKEFVDIQAEVPGVIVELLVQEGDHVEEGAVLLRLDDLQLRADVESVQAQVGAADADARNAEVGVATAEANLAAEKTALANANVEAAQSKTSMDRALASYKRKESLHQQGLIGAEEFEIAEAEAQLAEQRFEFSNARIRQAEANIRAAETRIDAAKALHDAARRRFEAQKASLRRVEDLADKTVLRAPISGLITACNVEKGERAVPGIQSNPIATLMTIADMSVIEAEIEVDEADIVAVALGQHATVEVDAIRALELGGTVTEIGQSPIPGSDQQEGKEFKVVVRIDEPPPALRPGFTATAEIETATRDDCLVVPLQALVVRERERGPDGELVVPPKPVEGEPEEPAVADLRVAKEEVEGVFVMADGVARFRPLETGITGDMDIEVLSGIDEGVEIVIGPYQKLRTLAEWDRVKLDEKRRATVDVERRP